jgi:hypothetical protein
MVRSLVRPPRPVVTIERITALLIVLLLGVFLLGFLPPLFTSFGYLVLVLATIVVVRSVPVEPGAWLGLRVVRRGLVVLISLITLDLLTFGSSYNATQFPVVFVLALADFALGRATRRIASAEAIDLDERQESLRNRAHRIAYAILAVSVGLVLLVADVATPGSHQWLADAVHGGPALSFLQLLFFLPAMVIAWIEPDRISDDDAPRLRQSGRARLAYVMVALSIILPIVFSITLIASPIRTSALTVADPIDGPAVNGVGVRSCGNDHGLYFDARKDVGRGVVSSVPITAVACWNGTRAYPLWGMFSSDCHPGTTEWASASTLTCRQATHSDGTLTFTYRTRLRAVLLPFISRDVVMTVSLTKDGKVVQFP